jgi:1-deoxy-D-xylulose-5-phosphate synthase
VGFSFAGGAAAGDIAMSGLLDTIEGPADLRRLAVHQLPDLAAELRAFLLESVSGSGGHLSSGLGVVELSVALHFVFDSPTDSIIWDVGHQGYPHKVLTGRREQLRSVRRRSGISGFLRRDESPHDAFGAGHSSTSISAAAGIAAAHARAGSPARAVAVIGDGALTAGLAFEALNHAGGSANDVIVVLNDNGMSISPNVGALHEGRPTGDDPGRQRAFFESLGFCYHGPVDGHDVGALVPVLATVRATRGPQVVHVLTRKGQGYAAAEAEPIKYHGVTPFDPAVGIRAGASAAPTYTQCFGDWAIAAAERDPRVVVVTPAMREGSGLVAFQKRFPDRYHDVGIAEQHCLTFAAGLAAQGLRPIVAIYSTFLQRAYDQLVHDIAIQQLPVVFAIDRAGLVGPDGATHNGAFDLSFLRCVPGMTVLVPSDGAELAAMLDAALELGGPVAVRYPRTQVPAVTRAPLPIASGRGFVRRRGRHTAILAFGPLIHEVAATAERLDATLVDMRFVKPVDVRLLLELSRTHRAFVTVEENALAGGAGSAVAEVFVRHGLTHPLLNLGLPDTFTEHGTREEVLADAGLDAASLDAQIEAFLARGANRVGQSAAAARMALAFTSAAGRMLATLSPAAPGRGYAFESARDPLIEPNG